MRKKLVSAERLQVVHDLVNGMHSGIPYCCIQEFLILRKQTGIPAYTQRVRFPELYPPDLQYVPCAECLRTGSFVQLKFNGGLPIEPYLMGEGPDLPSVVTISHGPAGEEHTRHSLKGEPL